MHEVLKRRDGSIVTARLLGTPRDHIFKTCGKGHKLKWGPFCRVMKRPPKGREYVVLECKTCGDYVEIVNPDSIEIANKRINLYRGEEMEYYIYGEDLCGGFTGPFSSCEAAEEFRKQHHAHEDNSKVMSEQEMAGSDEQKNWGDNVMTPQQWLDMLNT